MKSLATVAVLLCASLTACSDGSDVLGPDGDQSLMTRLQTPTTLEIDAAASLVAVTAFTDQNEEAMPIQFTLVEGLVDIRADDAGDVVIHAFSFGLEDVTVGPDLLPPDGLELREMDIRMEYPVVASPEWTATTASAEIPMHITADWSAVFNGNVYPLRSIELPQLVVQADLSLVDGVVSAQVSASRVGTFWGWADRFEMADLVVEVDAAAQ